MNVREPYMAHAREFGPTPEECASSPYEALMFYELNEAERHFVADLAVRRNISADDPIWHNVELTALVRRWIQESLESMREASRAEIETLRAEAKRLRAETERLWAQHQTDQQAAAENLQRDFARRLEQVAKPLEGRITTTVQGTVREELRGIARRQAGVLIGSGLGLLVLIAGAGFLTGRAFAPGHLTAAEEDALRYGTQLQQRYDGLNKEDQITLHRLMGWEPPTR